MKLLITGGTGYIKGHTAILFAEAGHDVVLLDNFYNHISNILHFIESILGKALPFFEVDVRNTRGGRGGIA